jgi:hypothetical protein
MNVSDKIYQEVKKLPEPLQAEALDFVQYLASKAKREFSPDDDLSHTDLSLSLAMRGIVDEDTPAYSLEDLKEVFS